MCDPNWPYYDTYYGKTEYRNYGTTYNAVPLLHTDYTCNLAYGVFAKTRWTQKSLIVYTQTRFVGESNKGVSNDGSGMPDLVHPVCTE